VQEPSDRGDHRFDAGERLLQEAEVVADVLVGRVDLVGDARRQLADGLQPLGAGQLVLDSLALDDLGAELFIDPGDQIVAPLHSRRRPHAGGEDLPLEGFRDIVVRARVQTADHVVVGRLGSDQEHRDVPQLGIALQMLAGFDAVHPGHHDVQENHVGVFAGRQFQGLYAAIGGHHAVALALQDVAQQGNHVRRIVDD
jgi:hypothetical protein